MLAYIGIGSNLNNPEQQIKAACAALQRLPDSQWHKASSCYTSTPMGPQNQPDYANAVVAIETQLSCRELLLQLQHIENNQGRVRLGERWGPRTLDLDIILYGDVCINDPDLTVPHYGCKQREFVIYPLAEIAPELIFPDGETIQQVQEKLPLNGLRITSTLDYP